MNHDQPDPATVRQAEKIYNRLSKKRNLTDEERLQLMAATAVHLNGGMITVRKSWWG